MKLLSDLYYFYTNRSVGILVQKGQYLLQFWRIKNNFAYMTKTWKSTLLCPLLFPRQNKSGKGSEKDS